MNRVRQIRLSKNGMLAEINLGYGVYDLIRAERKANHDIYQSKVLFVQHVTTFDGRKLTVEQVENLPSEDFFQILEFLAIDMERRTRQMRFGSKRAR